MDDFFHKKQNQLYMYLEYKGFADWKKIRTICDDLITSLPEREQAEKYGKYPIYELFYPLVYNGLVEPTTDTIGFVIAPNVPLFLGNRDPKDFMTHFYTDNSYEIVDKWDLRLNASKLLNRYPSLEDKIKSWGNPNYPNFRNIYIKTNLYNLNRNERNNNIPSFCIFKNYDNVYSSDYIKIENASYEIPDIFDALNIARSFIRANNGYEKEPLFTYDERSKELSFTHYNEIPTIIYRALLMYDIDQLKDERIYTSDRSNLPFKNVPIDAFENLKRIYKYNNNYNKNKEL